MAARESQDHSQFTDAYELTLDFHLLGVVPFAQFLSLQQRLVAAAASGQARTIPVLLCEHPSLISVGRSGSRAHIRLTGEQLERRGVSIEWVARGGGCVLHGPGQLAIYPIVPLHEVGWSVGEYLRRFRQGLLAAVDLPRLATKQTSQSFSVWGQTGLLAAVGVKVQRGVAHYGAYLNVCPDMTWSGFIDTAASVSGCQQTTMSCLSAERRSPVHMASVRTAVITGLSESLNANHHHIHAGHPWLTGLLPVGKETL